MNNNTEHQLENTPPQHVLDLEPGSTEADWRRHPNGGGWVYRDAQVAATAYVGPNAEVSGRAEVCDNARIGGGTIL